MMTRLVCIIFLLACTLACVAGFVAATAKVESYNARVELVRCQQGFQLACKKMVAQQIADARGAQ